ncbi:hypothetical protein [Proteus terrae]|jgi:biopolymer transport protein ExbD|uniref:hypothetical protein n=1 Tax=Proteus terrae TaxID=1574161 RepID=UPI00298CE28D|nr:hypothetical protein [Proteus terrae]WPD00331.1 hypothetical protein R5P25_07425 [Proteus terrae]
MRLLMLLSVFLISACSSTGAIESQDSKSHKEDPYSDSTLNSIKTNQNIYIEQQRSKGNF